MLSVLPKIGSKECLICFRPAYGHNFGALSCDACKMFFRRIITLNLRYACSKNNECFLNYTSQGPLPKCKACRFQKCINIGMQLNFPNFINTKKEMNDELEMIIGHLMYLDSRRTRLLLSNFTFEDPGLEDLICSNRVSLKTRDPNYEMTSDDWCFFGVVAAVQFLMGLNFMRHLDPRDKFTLLQYYGAHASLLFSSLRSARAKSDKLIRPDGLDYFDKWSLFSQEFLLLVRTRLVNRLIELKITDEECILISVILFANPALPSLSKHSCDVISIHQKHYSDALFQYCKVNYQQSAPSRFTDLLSLCHVINKHYSEIQYLYLFYQANFPNVHYKKLIAKVIETEKNMIMF